MYRILNFFGVHTLHDHLQIKFNIAGLGFAYELRLARDGKHGGPGENNTWTGMIGELVRGVR